MPRPSLIRRLLPWIYTAVFVLLAPVIVLYTAGYRYNTKKGFLERNGTLIADTTPEGARLILDGRNTGEKTPITLQNIAPGWHDIRLARDGDHAWQKSLELRADEVTFVNHVWLWRDALPQWTDTATATEKLFEREPSRAIPASEASVKFSTSSARLWTPSNERGVELLPGRWRVSDVRDTVVALRDGNRWAVLDADAERQTEDDQVQGDRPRWLSGALVPTALFMNDRREIWLWRAGSSPELIWRQSEPMVDILWHRSGSYVIAATKRRLFAIELDDRNGRLTTPLAEFDEVSAIIFSKKVLFILGRRGVQTGAWKLEIE